MLEKLRKENPPDFGMAEEISCLPGFRHPEDGIIFKLDSEAPAFCAITVMYKRVGSQSYQLPIAIRVEQILRGL